VINYSENNITFILKELKEGNERAFDYLFNRYYKTLCHFAYSFVKDQDIAEGQVQEVFIKLWKKRTSIDEVTNILSYLMSMVRNQSIDFLRTQKSHSKIYSKLKFVELDDTTEEQILKDDFEEMLLKSIGHLPVRCQEAFGMSRLDGLSNKEIAQRLQISVKEVEALIGRSLKMLRVELREFLPSNLEQKHKNGSVFLFSLLFHKFRKLNFLV
jgi:RNA polymerase sigma-70 factor (ECF subfamily)